MEKRKQKRKRENHAEKQKEKEKRKKKKSHRRKTKKKKTRRKKAGKFIHQSKVNEGIQGCNTLRQTEILACRDLGGLKNYKKQQSKKKWLKKMPHPHLPHMPHLKSRVEKHNEEMRNMEWGDMGF